MALSVNPLPRYMGMMAELGSSNQLILFGGRTTADNSYGSLLNESFNWDGSKWNLISTGISGNTLTLPSPRHSAAMAYDGTYVTMVGGANAIRNLTDTYSYSVGTGWFKQAITDTVSATTNTYTIPTKLHGASMAYQSGVGGGTALLFGGEASSQRHYSKDLFTWTAGNPGSWVADSPTTSPSGRTYCSMASNSTTALVFGGKSFGGPLATSFTYSSGNFTQVATGQTPGISSPAARYGASMVWNAATSSFIMMGGLTANAYSNECWSFSLVSNTWTKVAGGPPGRAYAQMAYHTASSSVILFSGLSADRVLTDTWSMSSSGVWTQLG